jgi:hypothetical protein
MTAAQPDDHTFWDVAASVLERRGVTRSTMMGYPCLRLHGDFFASWDPTHDALIVKLDRPSVADSIAAGEGQPFAPNGRTFREWISIPATDAGSWSAHLDRAFELAVARAAKPPTRQRRTTRSEPDKRTG